jgi:hypothetical protein
VTTDSATAKPANEAGPSSPGHGPRRGSPLVVLPKSCPPGRHGLRKPSQFDRNNHEVHPGKVNHVHPWVRLVRSSAYDSREPHHGALLWCARPLFLAGRSTVVERCDLSPYSGDRCWHCSQSVMNFS